MSANPRLPRLYVEGENDRRVILALLSRFGIELDKSTGPVVIESKGSCSELLTAFAGACKSAQSFESPVGFVLDCDRAEDNRKQQLIDRFREIRCELSTDEFMENGIVKEVEGINVGVWLMPDPSATCGKLESFLRTMIPSDDPILPLSSDFVARVVADIPERSRFRDVDREKAEISSWLAVQKNPGASYGVAITSRALSVDSPSAVRFCSWFRRLYGVSDYLIV